MNMRSKTPGSPPIGMATWLLRGGRMIDRISWAIAKGFDGISFLDYIMDLTDLKEREETAALIRSAGLYLTYHVNTKRFPRDAGGHLSDPGWMENLAENVLWWHDHTPGVASCCFDPIHKTGTDGAAVFDVELNRHQVTTLARALTPHGIRVGIENAFGGGETFCGSPDFARFKALCEPGLGLLFDTGHANVHVRHDGLEGETTIGSFISRLPLEVFEVHVSDNQGKEDEHRELGAGNLDVDGLCGALKGADYKGAFTIEVCLDAKSGRLQADFTDAKQTDPIVRSRDRLRAAWMKRA